MSLLIHIDNIPEEGIQIRESFDRSWLINIPEYTRKNEFGYVKDQIQLEGHLEKEGRNLHLRARVKLEILTICSRCGIDMSYPIDSKFDIVLMPKTLEDKAKEKELGPEDLDHLYYFEKTIELSDYFREQIALEIPIQFLCSEGCKGLCPKCGANLNIEGCSCSGDEPDPRLRIFQNLKIQK